MKKLLLAFVLAVTLLSLFPATVRADGIIIPPPCPRPACPPPPPCPGFECPPIPPRPMAQLVIRYHHVTVSIEDQIAVTHVDQVFYNPNEWPIEGTYLFPLPVDAVVSNFTLWVDGKPVDGQVLSAEEARRVYEETTRSLRDPALLEYAGRGAVRASIFPISPKGERRVELEYTQALTAQNGLVRYLYPLGTEKYSLLPLEDVSIRVEIRDRQSIRAVYSPSHPLGLDRQDENHVIAGYEAKNAHPDSDFTLYYSLGESEAFHLFSYRDPSDPADPDGFFLLLLAPKPEVGPAKIAKDVLLVLDRSGSMEGEKFQQAQSALRFILKKLNPEDRFYLAAFSTGLETYASGLRPASESAQALRWVDGLSASGSTDINRALLDAAEVVDPSRLTYLIFLTDGLPTEGVIDSQQILNNVAKTAPPNLRVFPFGVGYDVDTVLLDTLSQEHHGQSTYVRPGESLSESLSAFYERISTPVLTDLQLDFGKLATYDIYPDPLPDLFSGGQVIVVGRYRGDVLNGKPLAVDISLRGQVNGVDQQFRYPEQVFRADSRGDPGHLDALPRLWATRKIGYLLNRVRLQGPDKETIEQIVKLSVRYGIVTPYTSYLVAEDSPLGAAAQDQMAENALQQAQAAPAQASGQGAVDRAAEAGKIQSADVAPQSPSTGAQAQGRAIRVVGARTFLYQDGAWLDTGFDPQAMQAQKVVFLSETYFKLLAARPDLAAALALGDQITLVVDGKAYQVVPEDSASGPVDLPLAFTPSPASTTAAGQAATATPAQVAQQTAQPSSTPAKPKQTARPSGCAAGLVPLGLVILAVPLRKRWKRKLKRGGN